MSSEGNITDASNFTSQYPYEETTQTEDDNGMEVTIALRYVQLAISSLGLILCTGVIILMIAR